MNNIKQNDNVTETIRQQHEDIFNKVQNEDIFFNTMKNLKMGW